ncbi:MAG: PH domain-containing protein [Saprospiraceae bacterium]
MKKSNHDFDFSAPHRQSAVAILMIIWKTYRILVRQAWPILLILFFKGNTGKTNYLLVGIVLFSVLGMVFSLINYFRFYFYIEKDELIINSGVLNRKNLNVPFDRIQTINFEQNIAHRIFNVVRLKIDTAGSSKSEFNFHAIDIKKADALRNLILSKRKATPNKIVTIRPKKIIKDFDPIMKLEFPNLIKAGAVENHLKSGGLIIAFMFWIWQSLDDIDMFDPIEKNLEAQLNGGLAIAAILVFTFLVLSFLISMAKMIITNFDLKFLRSDNGFKVQTGLFTKKDISALDHKIQMISWSDNLLKKIVGIKDLTLKQASSVAGNKKTSIKIPGCSDRHIDQVKYSLYGYQSFDDIMYHKIEKKYLYRNGGILLLAISTFIVLAIYLQLENAAVLGAFGGFFFLFTFYLSFKKKKYGFNDEMLVIRGGTYGDKTIMMPIYKIQSISKQQSPYQKRNNLADLVFYTASGRVGIPYILNDTATAIMDSFLYKIEMDKRKWM